MRFYLTLIVMLFLLFVAFVFGSQNEQVITLSYMIAKVDLSIAAAVSLFTLIGVILGMLICLLWKLSRSLKKDKSKA